MLFTHPTRNTRSFPVPSAEEALALIQPTQERHRSAITYVTHRPERSPRLLVMRRDAQHGKPHRTPERQYFKQSIDKQWNAHYPPALTQPIPKERAPAGERRKPILREACSQAYPESAICVQRFDDSLNSAIRITYRISLRSSSLREPRYPLLRVVFWLLNEWIAPSKSFGERNCFLSIRKPKSVQKFNRL